jgi:hypothetical protein
VQSQAASAALSHHEAMLQRQQQQASQPVGMPASVRQNTDDDSSGKNPHRR